GRAPDRPADPGDEDRRSGAQPEEDAPREQTSEEDRAGERDEGGRRRGRRSSQLVAEVEAGPRVHRPLDEEREQDRYGGDPEGRGSKERRDRERRVGSLGRTIPRSGPHVPYSHGRQEGRCVRQADPEV